MVFDTLFSCYIYNIIKSLFSSLFYVARCSVAEISVMQILTSLCFTSVISIQRFLNYYGLSACE